MSIQEINNLISQYNLLEESEVIFKELEEVRKQMNEFVFEHSAAINNESQSHLISMLTYTTRAMAKCRSYNRKIAAVMPEGKGYFKTMHTYFNDALNILEELYLLIASHIKDNKALQVAIAEAMMHEADVENLQ